MCSSSALYYGTTTHARRHPSRNRFKYPLYMALVDLDDLCAGRLDNWPIFSSTSPYALTALLDRDHMIHEDQSRDLCTRVRDFVQRHTSQRPCGRIKLLTNLRVLGVEFNPVSFYYVMHADDDTQVESIVAEVANFPWFEQYAYHTTPIPHQNQQQQQQKLYPYKPVDKQFHVSPFMPFSGLRYHWQFSNPQQAINVRISLTDMDDEPVFYASLDAQRRPWSTSNLLRMQWQYPWHSLFVMAGILYEAAKLFRKGFTFFPHPTGVTSRLSRLVEFFVRIGLLFTQLFAFLRPRNQVRS